MYFLDIGPVRNCVGDENENQNGNVNDNEGRANSESDNKVDENSNHIYNYDGNRGNRDDQDDNNDNDDNVDYDNDGVGRLSNIGQIKNSVNGIKININKQ